MLVFSVLEKLDIIISIIIHYEHNKNFQQNSH